MTVWMLQVVEKERDAFNFPLKLKINFPQSISFRFMHRCSIWVEFMKFIVNNKTEFSIFANFRNICDEK
jgi:hypothetical protein